MAEKSRLGLIVQLIVGLVILLGVGIYVGIQNLLSIFLSLDVRYIILCLFAYFIMNLIFAYRLKRVLKILGKEVKLGNLLLIQYGGMLASDFTPARSGYFAVPVMLKDEGVPVQVGLSSILGIQSIEFLVKMMGGVLALAYLVSHVSLSRDVFVLSVVGVFLMLAGSLVIALAMWSHRAISVLKFFEKLPLIGKVTRVLLEKIVEFQKESEKVRDAIFSIVFLTVISWIVKGFEWWFIGLAMGITEISFIGYLLLHPLITALSFVPLTPSGIGFQEGGIVGVLFLLGIGVDVGLAFALLARFLLVLQDLIGVIPISRTGVRVWEFLKVYRWTTKKD